MNIYIFWLGDEGKKEKLVKLQKEFNSTNTLHKIIIGPSKEEHEYLISNYDYYRKSFNKKIFSFCSDVWRFWMTFTYGGLYIDANIRFTSKSLNEYLNKESFDKEIFVLENKHSFLSGFFYSYKGSKTTERILKMIKKFNIMSPKNYTIAPDWLTKSIIKEYKYRISDFDKTNLPFKLIPITDFDSRNNANLFVNGSTGSWTGLSQETINKYWIKTFDTYSHKIKSTDKIYFYARKFHLSRIIWILTPLLRCIFRKNS